MTLISKIRAVYIIWQRNVLLLQYVFNFKMHFHNTRKLTVLFGELNQSKVICDGWKERKNLFTNIERTRTKIWRRRKS